MTLQPGTKLGHYEVVSSLGAGGMGEVYRAKDTHLGREVAIKLLLEEVSADTERLARFEREARVLASLNHNNIATLHGFEKEGDTSFLVMELVEGETLAERIKRGPIPVDEALPLFLQIAEGLEAAHEKGVIHRDLKPANIKVTDDGQVKILDFGLAKAMAGGTAAGDDPAMSPTLTHDVTLQGQIMGTAGYMSPEQVRGEEADRRTDVWAFGCCLFEALSGEQAFGAATTQDTLAKVLEREPRWEALPADLNGALRRLLLRCVEKNHRDRLHDIGDARLALRDAESAEREEDMPPPAHSARRRWAITSAMALTVALAILGGWLAGQRRSSATPGLDSVRRMSMNLTVDQPLHHFIAGMSTRNMAISPNGRTVVYVSPQGGSVLDGRSILVVRDVGSLKAEIIQGTEGAADPFFSPDGAWLGFSVPGEGVKKLRLGAGGTELVAPAAGPLLLGAGAWGEDGYIYFVDGRFGGAAVLGTLMRVPEAGGVPEAILPANGPSEEWFIAFPEVLPGGRALLMTVFTGIASDAGRIEVLDLATGDRQVLAEKASMPRFVGGESSSEGYVVFAQVGSLAARAFDVDRLRATGPVVDVTEVAMRMTDDPSPRRWALSRNGILVYSPGRELSLLLVGRDGQRVNLPSAPAPQAAEPRATVSPDGRRIAVAAIDGDIWIYDRQRQTAIRLIFPGFDSVPIWSMNGEDILFASDGDEGTRDVYRRAADGTGAVEKLATHPYNLNPGALTPNESALITLHWGDPETSADIGLLELPGSGTVEPLLQTEFIETNPNLSPDGRWLAYQSDESGRQEVYVQPFPTMSGRVMISKDGGEHPVWAQSGKELFYWSDGGIMAVSIETSVGLQPGLPERLFEGSYDPLFDVLPDGKQFVMVEARGDQELVVVENWFEELKRLVPTD